MQNKKPSTKTKKALICSVLSLVLCFTMLIGSTFAWFTDSATTGVNKIVAGNLDIKLSYKNANDTEYSEVTEDTTDLFVDQNGEALLWETGAVSVCYFKLENCGKLDIKYVLSVIAKDVVKGEDGAALSKVLKTAVVELTGESDVLADRAASIEKAEAEDAKNVLSYKKENLLMADGATEYFAMVIYFPAEIGNTYENATYNLPEGAEPLETTLQISLVATQASSEKDSFDELYDKEAVYPVVDASSLKDAFESGKDVVKLEGDIVIDAAAICEDTILDLNGKSLSVVGTDSEDGIVVSNGAALTIKNGSMSFDDETVMSPIKVTNNEAGTTTTLNLQSVDMDFAGNADEESLGILAEAEEGEVVVNIGEGVNITSKAMHEAPVVVGKNATVVMAAGEISASQQGEPNSWTSLYGVKLTDATSVFTMNGGTINADGQNTASAICANSGTVNLNGGTINVTAGNANTEYGYSIGIEAYTATLNLNGGTINVMSPGAYDAEAFDVSSKTVINYDKNTSTLVVNLYQSIWEGNRLSEDASINGIITPNIIK